MELPDVLACFPVMKDDGRENPASTYIIIPLNPVTRNLPNGAGGGKKRRRAEATV